MKLFTSAQMRELDRHVIEELGVPGRELMQNASAHIASAVMDRLPDGGRTAVFCGTGNNGGDGIGAAALLMQKAVPVKVFLVGSMEKLTEDSREMLALLNARGGVLERFKATRKTEDYLRKCSVIIDALFGTGLNSELRGDALKAVEMINESGAYVVSADIASGVQADTGCVLGEAVRANMTVTFTAAKPGHFAQPGCIYTGELRVCDIGIPRGLAEAMQSETYAVIREDISLPRRRPVTHKGDYGRCLVVAGSTGYTGAPVLASRAASRMGAGLVFLGIPEPVYGIAAVKCDVEMVFPLPDDGTGKVAGTAADEIIRRAQDCDAVLIGPGLGRSRDITELVVRLIRSARTPVVLDADGINALEGNIDILDEAACPLILTPHDGEFLRLGGDLTSGNRLLKAREFAAAHGCVLVLKGHRTITALPDGTAYINTTGGPAMAKGGSGDVLAGMITALIGQKFPIKDAVLAAVYLHGFAGELCAFELGEYSVAASDIIETLPKAVKKVISLTR